MNNPDHNYESLKKLVWVKYLKYLMWIQDPGWKKFGSGMEKSRIRDSGSGIKIPDPSTTLSGSMAAIK
jgi:hypothetical protein